MKICYFVIVSNCLIKKFKTKKEPFAHVWHIKSNTTFRFYLIDFQLTTDFPSQCYVVYRKITLVLLKDRRLKKMLLQRTKPVDFSQTELLIQKQHFDCFDL